MCRHFSQFALISPDSKKLKEKHENTGEAIKSNNYMQSEGGASMNQ